MLAGPCAFVSDRETGPKTAFVIVLRVENWNLIFYMKMFQF